MGISATAAVAALALLPTAPAVACDRLRAPHRPVWTPRAAASPCRCRTLIASAAGEQPDPLGLVGYRQELLQALAVSDTPIDGTAHTLCELYHTAIAPLEPAIWNPEYDGRADAICRLSIQLDILEETARGPLLAGRAMSHADGLMFPSMCVMFHALPEHFGWERWTTEAIFYKRPRLHAWWELMSFEDPASEVEARVSEALASLGFEWGQPVPTSHVRSMPAHAQ